MEHASTLPALPPFKDLRAGQKQVVDLFASASHVVAQLPTGYGKTLTAACSYLTLKQRGLVNRMLYIVPRGAQAAQAAEEVPALIYLLTGIRTKAFVVGESQITAMAAHRRGDAEIFVVTVQSLVSSPATEMTIREMMQTGRWFGVIDEHHHFGSAEDSVWTQRVMSLPLQAWLAMSATPDRADGRSGIGKPNVVVTYLDALEEGCVKALRLHAYEYQIDAVTVRGEVIPFSTKDLLEAVGSENPADIDKWLASRQMRWSPKYISPLVLHPIERMLDLRVNSVKSQMLIQALSCAHAEMVCEQVRSIVPPGMTADWVGTGPNGRSDAENQAVLERFCPPKDAVTGKRRWSLDILINVGIAGEGLDTTDVCEIVFLTSPNITNSSLQTIGRGARIMRGLERQPVCTVNVDGASEFAKFLGENVMLAFDGESNPEKKIPPPPPPGEYEPLPDSISVGVLDVTLVDIRKDPMFQGVLDLTLEKNKRAGMSDDQARRFSEMAAEAAVREYMKQRDERFNASAVEAQGREKLQAAVSKLSGLVIRMMTQKTGVRVEKSFPGSLVKRINSQKKAALGAVEASDAAGLERHYAWVKQLEAQLLRGEVPAWLR